jgi:outer membrane protein
LAAEAPESPPLTFKECYYMALARSETLQMHDEEIVQAKAKYQRALSGILPRLSFKATEFRQDASGSETFTLRSRPSKYFTLSQPLFKGFKEFSAMAAMRAEEMQRRLERQRAEEALYLEVAEAFFAMQRHEEERAILQESEDLARERLEELQEREALGKSRPSETASASAYLKSVQADRAAAEGRLEAARQMLGFLIGRGDAWRVAEADAAPVASEIKSLEAYLGRVEARADVQAAQEAVRVAEQEVRVAGADRWPSVTADANYYTQREGFYEPIDWDVTLTMSVPIFQGGQTVGAVREARSLARQVSLLSAQTRRDAERDVRTAYAEAAASRASWTAFEEAVAAAEEDARLQREDYRLGLVNHLDILASLDRLQQARLNLAEARANALTQEARLAVSVGEVP